MNKIIVVAFLLSSLSFAAEEPLAGLRLRQDHKAMVRANQSEEFHEAIITASGTAFGVDLSEFGIESKHIVLTVAHNVIAGDNKADDPKVEFDGGWHKTTTLYMDEELDLALLEVVDEVPARLAIAKKSAQAKDKVVMQGAPQGVPVKKVDGIVERRYWHSKIWTLVMLAFDHGDSGAPLMDKDGNAVGIADAGVPEDLSGRFLKKDQGLFIPVEAIRYFIGEYIDLKKANKK